MSILTESKYLDELTFSSGLIKDEDCVDIADWTTDGDTGSGVSSQASFDGKSCFKMDTVAAGGSNLASRALDIGSYQTNPNVVSIKLYHDTLGTLAAVDYFELILQATTYRCRIIFASDGLYIYDGASWNEVGTNLVQQDTWQEWTFSWTQQASGVVDVYLDGVSQATGVDCSDSTAGTTGTTTFRQYGTTVIGLTYIDWIKAGNAQRHAGEVWLMQEGGQLTIRTDTRWYGMAPASMTGSLGSITVTEGKVSIDATNVRWLPYDSGSGNVPAIGTSVTQAGVSVSYLLGVYDTLTSAPTAVGAAMPADGFLKFREVTGAFAAGALTGIGASATGVDVTGWLEVVCDDAANITVPRLGQFTTRGDWFYLDNTNGSVGQVLQLPTNGGGANTLCPGVWIERTTPNAATYTWISDILTITLTSHGYVVGQNVDIDFTSGGATADGEFTVVSVPTDGTFTCALTGSGTGGNCTVTSFDYWPAVTSASGNWARQHIGGPYSGTDVRQNYVKDNGTGQLLIGEASDLSATYANIAGQASTDYDSVSHASTYTWANNLVTVTYATGHLLKTGQQVYLDFTSGDATPDGTYPVTVIDAFSYTVPLTGSGTGGNVTVRPGFTINFTAHTLGVGDSIYCDFIDGPGVDGDYTIYAVTGANAYNIEAPHSSAASNNDVTVYSRYQISSVAHGLAIGNRVYLDFTTGSGVDGIYTIVAVTADNFDVVANNNASADSGNVTVKQTIGHVPASGLRTRVPNIFLRSCATGSRASNAIPNATLATRPEFISTSAGYIDMEYVYSQWYHRFGQPYLAKHHHFAVYDILEITECASALDLHDGGVGPYNQDVVPLTLTSNFAGGTVKNCKFVRGGAPANSDHIAYLSYCIGQTFRNVICACLQYARLTGYPFQITYCTSITLRDCISINAGVAITSSFDTSVYNIDHVDRLIGYTNATVKYVVIIATKCDNIMVDGMSWGRRFNLTNVHSSAGFVSCTASDNITVRNAGTATTPLSGGTFRVNYYGMATNFVSGGNNTNVKVQRIYVDDFRTGLLTTVNSDKGTTYESVYGGLYVMSAMAIFALLNTGLNSIIKGVKTGQNTTTGQTSVYGTHFLDMFLGDTTGRFILAMNEPTAETAGYFTMVSGTAKWNSVGGILMSTVGDQAVWEDSVFRLGHTGFVNSTPTMSGGTIGNYTLEYQIDTGSGYGAWNTANGANLSGETITPSTGFKMKVRITTTTANSTAITYLRFDTTSSSSAQADNLYTLDTSTITLNNLVPGSRYEIYNTTTSETIANAIATGTTASVSASASEDDQLRVRVRKSIDVSQASTYTWSANVITVTYSAHGRYVGEPVYLDFTSGDAVGNNGNYTIVTTPTTGTYTVALSGSGTGGNVTSTPAKYLPFETAAIIDNLAASVYVSQIEDSIAEI